MQDLISSQTQEEYYSLRFGMWAKCPDCVSASLSVFYVLAILYLQSLLSSYLLSLTSALNNLSCNATLGAVWNLLLLAEGPRNINKPKETMGPPEWASLQNCCAVEGTGRPALHFLCYWRESSVIVRCILRISMPVRFPHFLTFLPCYLYPLSR